MRTEPPIRFCAVLAAIVFLTTAHAASAQETISGWPVAAPDYDQDTIEALDDAIAAETYQQINSVIVVRDGQLLIERYYNGASRDGTHNPRSVGKTFTGTILGIALDEGFIKSIDQRLGEFYELETYDNHSEKKAGVSLRHLLTMTSGFDGFDFERESPGNEENMYPTPNWVEWTLNLPMAGGRTPGDEWRYFTAGIVVLGDILNQHVPGGLEAYAHRKLFDKLGITNYQWQYTPQHVANTAGGLALTPLGFAKYGELHRNRGRWGDEQVVPAAWIDESMRPGVETVVEGNRYGYLWWHKSYPVGGESWPVSYCTGNGGNKIFVFDDQPLVIVVTASAYGRRYMHSQVDEMMTEYILPAVSE